MSSVTRADDIARRDGVMPSKPDAATSTSSLAPLSSSSASAPGWGAAGPVAILIDELIGALRPTPASDRRRRAVFQHVADLINGCFENENVLVTAFGSVPLRTYLPDGDIDVCLLGPHELLAKDPCWTSRLRDHIEFAEADAAAHDAVSPFAVSEIHVVHAEVRLMKCICDGVVVDISANQFGGLATLGFLEEADAFVSARLKSEGLFKRSIVLIKAWGFYEGRLLGAHHALISTYALETLVLYVLNKFHKKASLTTPLEVLHTFLRVFAEFDWDTHAVSIHGPVRIADLVAGTATGEEPAANVGAGAEDDAEDELLTREFMWRMLDKYGNESIMRQHAARGERAAGAAGAGGRAPPDELPPPGFLGGENAPRVRMPIKHMNVIDPLLPSNNLGRSVSQGNAARIRKALKLAAAKLGALREMSTRSDSCDFLAARVLREFFGNTAKHRRVALLPSAPATPGGREHADEVSMTPATGARRHSVTVLQSPHGERSARESGRTALEAETSSSRVSGDALGDDGSRPSPGGPARRLEASLSDPALSGLRVRVDASASSGSASPAPSSGSDSPRWPHLGPASPESERAELGRGCPVMHQTVRVEDEDRGPFWGRWEPLPAAELAAAAAAEALANRHFPRLSDASTEKAEFPDGEAARKQTANGDVFEREQSAAVAAAAFVAAADASARAATPRRARGLSLGAEGDFAEMSAFHRQLAGGSTPGSSRAESRGASIRGGGLFAETGADASGAGSGSAGGASGDATALSSSLPGGASLLGTSPTKGGGAPAPAPARRAPRASVSAGALPPHAPHAPPVPPGPPPPGAARAARDASAARVRREANVATFFPDPFAAYDDARASARASALMLGFDARAARSPPAPMPPPAVTPPETVGLGGLGSGPQGLPRDIFAGDLEAIWRHLEFGRHYHRVAMRRRYEYEHAAAQQHAAAAAAAAVRRGAFGPNGEFAIGRAGRGPRGGAGHSRGGSFSSSGEHAQREGTLSAGAPNPGAGKSARSRSRRRKGDAAGARDPAGAGFAAAAAAAIAAGAEPPRGRARRGGASIPNSGPSRSSERRENPRSKRGSEDEAEAEGEAAPVAPPGPPPGGVDGGAFARAAAAPSWGPKGAAALDVIRRAPSSADVVGAEAPKDASPDEKAPSEGVRAEGAAARARASASLRSATGAKGSWSSLVAAGESVVKTDARNSREGEAPPTRFQSQLSDLGAGAVGGASGARGAETPPPASEDVANDGGAAFEKEEGGAAFEKEKGSANASAATVDDTVPTAPPPSRRLAGAWAKGSVTDALKRRPTCPRGAGGSPPSPSSPASETSGDSNAEQKENPGARKKKSDVVSGKTAKQKEQKEQRDTEPPGVGGPSGSAPVPEHAERHPTFADDFPGLGGKPAATAAISAAAGVWGGRRAA